MLQALLSVSGRAGVNQNVSPETSAGTCSSCEFDSGLQLTQLCLIYVWSHLEVHVRGRKGQKRRGRDGLENALCWKEPSPTEGKRPGEESGTDFLPLPLALTMPGFLQLLIMMITVFLVCVCVCAHVCSGFLLNPTRLDAARWYKSLPEFHFQINHRLG